VKNPVLVDLRNIYDPRRMKQQGFEYTSVGRAAAHHFELAEVEH
jgi:UDPglucose 6-dehydrogenase